MTGSTSREREQGPAPHWNLGLRGFREAGHPGNAVDAERRDEEDHAQGEGRQGSENHRHDDNGGGQPDQLALRDQAQGAMAFPLLEDRPEERRPSEPFVQRGRRARMLARRKSRGKWALCLTILGSPLKREATAMGPRTVTKVWEPSADRSSLAGSDVDCCCLMMEQGGIRWRRSSRVGGTGRSPNRTVVCYGVTMSNQKNWLRSTREPIRSA